MDGCCGAAEMCPPSVFAPSLWPAARVTANQGVAANPHSPPETLLELSFDLIPDVRVIACKTLLAAAAITP